MKNLKRASEFAQHTSIILAFFSLFAGPLVVISFISRVSNTWGDVPISVAELYGSTLIPVIVLVAVFVVIYSSFLLLLNGFARNYMEGQLRIGFPFALRHWRSRSRRHLQNFQSKDLVWHFGQYFLEYVNLHLPVILLLILLIFYPQSVYLIIIGFLVGVFVLHFNILTKSKQSPGSDGYKSKIVLHHVWKTTGVAILINIVAFAAWFIAFWFFGNIYAATYGAEDSISDYDLYMVIPVVLFFDFLFFAKRTTNLNFSLGMSTAFISLVFFLQPSFVGAAAFRVLGFGGGMPASMLVKSTDADGKPQFVVIRGCLILNAGNQVVIEELAYNKNNSSMAALCRPRHWYTIESPEQFRKQFCSIGVYAREDVAIISSISAEYKLPKKPRNRTDGCN
jgi:hypothetical protein